jgi:ubiquinone/menaquinone biosynthesis C-methylase UbiE
MTSHYTFGDGDRAAARLALLADVYAPTTRAFLARLRTDHALRVDRALDLGCGPGHSTEVLHGAIGARETWGLDASERLLDRARARLGPPFAFATHDVEQSPFPVADVDLAYARHLLAHMPDPARVLVACTTAMRPGGMLVLEETSALDSTDAVFAEYYAHVRALQAHYGQDTFVGARLGEIAAKTPWTVIAFECRSVPLDARPMATLHAMNVRTWRNDPYASTAFDSERLDAMTVALDAVSEGRRAAPPVSCALGQAFLRI